MTRSEVPVEGPEVGIACVITALNHPDRRAIVARLAERRTDGETGLSVTQLSDALEITRFSASHHLGILGAAGIVMAAQRGTRKIVELRIEPLLDLWDWLIGVCEDPRG